MNHYCTYDHRLMRTGHPVRSAILKHQIGRSVVGWVTTSESLLLYVIFLLPFWYRHVKYRFHPQTPQSLRRRDFVKLAQTPISQPSTCLAKDRKESLHTGLVQISDIGSASR